MGNGKSTRYMVCIGRFSISCGGYYDCIKRMDKPNKKKRPPDSCIATAAKAFNAILIEVLIW
ncbi:hypothetical protein ANACOL_02948 [Anaerotruncus colihominis DSM 17241]|uniref:Uncharacterized protein n=1 Tax=Anaerotruncus colihominis DSM 17241 TaxID=445972 RepID=B0PEF7_9FIRM|nr:hypothetical protein ANACOL_02948 [Anaerotruncus colihominis DSM 17241]